MLDLLKNMELVFRALPGGLGISVILVGMLLAASTGIVGATVVTMGILSLPTMLRAGYQPALACGTLCATGTLGQIITLDLPRPARRVIPMPISSPSEMQGSLRQILSLSVTCLPVPLCPGYFWYGYGFYVFVTALIKPEWRRL